MDLVLTLPCSVTVCCWFGIGISSSPSQPLDNLAVREMHISLMCREMIFLLEGAWGGVW